MKIQRYITLPILVSASILSAILLAQGSIEHFQSFYKTGEVWPALWAYLFVFGSGMAAVMLTSRKNKKWRLYALIGLTSLVTVYTSSAGYIIPAIESISTNSSQNLLVHILQGEVAREKQVFDLVREERLSGKKDLSIMPSLTSSRESTSELKNIVKDQINKEKSSISTYSNYISIIGLLLMRILGEVIFLTSIHSAAKLLNKLSQELPQTSQSLNDNTVPPPDGTRTTEKNKKLVDELELIKRRFQKKDTENKLLEKKVQSLQLQSQSYDYPQVEQMKNALIEAGIDPHPKKLAELTGRAESSFYSYFTTHHALETAVNNATSKSSQQSAATM